MVFQEIKLLYFIGYVHACMREREREKALVIHIYNCFKINKKLEELSLIIVYSMNNALKDLKPLGQ